MLKSLQNRLLLAWTLISVLIYGVLCTFDSDEFLRTVSAADSAGYVAFALSLGHGTLAASSRTLGYPLFLAACALVDGSLRLAIALQLVANVGLAFGCWQLLARLTPTASHRWRAIAASVCFLSGLGLALQLMTDLLGAVYLFLALYGLLFWRGRSGIAVSALGLGLATLTRPTYTLFPLVLPLLAQFAARVHTRVSRTHVLLLAVCSLAATTVSMAYQYRIDGYIGPSSALTFNIEVTLHDALAPEEPFETYRHHFEERLARRAGVPVADLTRTAAEREARHELVEALKAHPVPTFAHLTRTAIKYLFVPIEALPAHVMHVTGADSAYTRFVRPFLFVAWLPLWLLAYWPPKRTRPRMRAYYGLTMSSLGFVIAMSAMAPAQGERMRLPVLAFLMPLAVSRLERRGSTRSAGDLQGTVPDE